MKKVTINFYLKNVDSKEETLIYALISYNGQRIRLNKYINEKIAASDWSRKKGLAKYDHSLNERLNKIKLIIKNIYERLYVQGNIISSRIFKEAMDAAFTYPRYDEKKILIIDLFQQFISDTRTGNRLSPRETKIQSSSIKAYNSVKRHLETFQEKRKKQFYLENINQKMVNDFKVYLVDEVKLSLNAIAKYFAIFKVFIAYAKDKDLITSNIFLEMKINARREKSDNIYLNEVEIAALMNYKEFSTDVYKLVRDLFVIGCYTGLRFSDYSVLNSRNFHGDYINLIQTKTQERVIIPIHPIVRIILEEYNYELPQAPPNQVFNRYIKEIGKNIPELSQVFEKKMIRKNSVEITTYEKWQLLQSHTCRRSFCTNMILKGIDPLTIMAASGHKTMSSFMTYIKVSNLQNAELLKKKWDEENKADLESRL